MTSQTVIDTDNRYGWAERLRVFDEDGFLIQEVLTYDDGRTKTTTFVDGVVINVALNDPLDAAIWTIRTTSYNETTGLIVGSSTSYDDGRSIVETYTDGIRATRTTTDRDNAFTWTSQVATYDTLGLLSQRVTTFDDGRIVTSSYTSNVVTTRTIVDSADAYNWAERVYTFDPATGQLLSRRTEYDSGVIETKTDFLGPLNGTRAQLDALDRFGWHSVTDTFDAVGLLSQRVRVNDDGVTQTTTYSAGQPQNATWVDVDDAKAWATRTGTYDAAGRLASLRITFDDGHVSQRTYTDGALTRRIDGDVSDAFGWHTRDFSYDANGQIIGSGITADDGTVDLRFYTDGILTLIQRHDAGENFGWSTIETKYGSAGVLLHTTRTEDDGSFTTRDARGLDVFEGTQSDTVVEDSAITLTASGAVTFVDGYRGSQTFNGFQNVTGLAGLGSFTVTNDGTWTYTAINNQFDVQTLNAGETITDSVQVTTHDGATVLITVEFQGVDDSAAPIYLGDTTELIGAVGNLAAPLSFDLGSLFSDDLGEDLTISLASIPTGFSVVDGVITITAANPLLEAGTQTVVITATDSTGQSVTQTVDLLIGLQNNFGASYTSIIGPIFDPRISEADDRLVFGDDSFVSTQGAILALGGDDIIQFGNFVASTAGELTIDGGAGDDTIQIGDGAGFYLGRVTIRGDAGQDTIQLGVGAGADEGEVLIQGGTGDDTYIIGGAAGDSSGSVEIYDDAGRSTVTFGNSAAANSGIVTFEGRSSADGADITFGASTAKNQGQITVLTGTADDVVRFGHFSFVDSNTLNLRTGDGKDSLTFGSLSFLWGTEPGLVGFAPAHFIDTGADDDTVQFGNFISLAEFRDPGETTGIDLRLGSGNDTATFGTDAGAALAQILIDAGAGDDTLTFGERAKFVSIQGGTGADTISFGDRAEDIIVDLGADTDADSLTMGWFTSLTLTNYDHTIDSLSVARVGDWVWHMVDDGVGTTTLQASGGPLITFNNTTGVAATDLLAGVNVNRDVEFIGTEADKDLGVIGVGNATPGFSANILSLFADPDITDGLIDSFKVRAGPLQSFMAFNGTTLSLSNLTDVSNVGLYSVNFTGSDIFGADVTETFTFEVGLHNAYGDITGVFYLDDIFNGSDFSDVMTVGTVFMEALQAEGATFQLYGGARNDVLTIGAVNIESNYSVFTVEGGTGDDQITVASFATSGIDTTQTVTGGTGADTITFSGDVQGLTIDLGADTDTDTLTFNGSVTNVTIQNWVEGDDAIVFTDRPAAERWEATVSGADVVYTNGEGQSFTVLGASGSNTRDVVTGIEFNRPPTYVGPAGASFTGEAGSGATEAFSIDLKTLFGDVDIPFGDSLTFEVSAPTLPHTLVNGVFTHTLPLSALNATDHVITVTVRDDNGEELQQNLQISLAMLHTFAAANTNNRTTNIIASSLGDDLVFGDDSAQSSNYLISTGAGADEITAGAFFGANSTLSIDLGSGNDTATFGSRLAHQGNVTITGGLGDDTITVGSQAARTNGTLTIDAGSGADQISLGAEAGAVTIDLGADVNADSLTIDRTGPSALTPKTITINNWSGGVGGDTISVINSAARWQTTESAGDKIFISSFGDTIVVTGAAGLADASVISGLTMNMAPTYVGTSSLLQEGTGRDVFVIGDAGSMATGTTSLNLDTLFSDPELLQLEYSFTGLPTALAASGSQIFNNPVFGINDPRSAGDHTVTITARDDLSASVSETVVVAVAMNHNFGNDFSGAVFGGSSIDDVYVYGTGAYQNITADFDTLGGNDSLSFGDNAFKDGVLLLDLGGGDDQVTFGDNAGQQTSGFGLVHRITINGGAGDDSFTFGDYLAQSAVAVIRGEAGVTTMVVGDYAGQNGLVQFSSDFLDDSFTVGNHAGKNGLVTINSKTGNDIISVGTHAGEDGGTLSVFGFSGVQTVTIGDFAGFNGGEANVSVGAGADSVTIGTGAETVTIDLGVDSDADTLVFLGTVSDGTISNWVQGTDTVDVVDHTAWSISSDDGTDTTLTDGTSSLTFLGITGLTDADDFLI